MNKQTEIKNKVTLPLSLGDLQFFGGGGDDPATPAANPEGGQDPAANPDQANPDPKPADQNTPPATNPADQTDPADDSTQKRDEKTFTQKDVSNISAREAKKAQEKFLKQLGVEDFETAKEGLKQFKEHQDAQKTESQKIQEQNEALLGEKDSYKSQVSNLEAQVLAMKSGVKTDSVSDVVVLANNLVTDDVDLETAMTQVVEKYPQFKQVIEQEENPEDKKKPSFSQGQHQSKKPDSAADKWKNAFNFGK